MQPLYFMPGRRLVDVFAGQQIKREILAQHDLADVFADVGTLGVDVVAGEIIGAGPGGQAGLIVSAFTPGKGAQPQSTYLPECQDWQPAGDGSRLWIGLDKRSPPTPEDLERRIVYSGYRLPVPGLGVLDLAVVRRPDGTSMLPRRMVWEDAKFVERLREQYAPLWNDLTPVCDWAFNGGQITNELAMSMAIRLMCLNYRYSRHEHNRLSWLDSENYHVVLWAGIDKPAVDRALDEREKKNVA